MLLVGSDPPAIVLLPPLLLAVDGSGCR